MSREHHIEVTFCFKTSEAETNLLYQINIARSTTKQQTPPVSSPFIPNTTGTTDEEHAVDDAVHDNESTDDNIHESMDLIDSTYDESTLETELGASTCSFCSDSEYESEYEYVTTHTVTKNSNTNAHANVQCDNFDTDSRYSWSKFALFH